jgi:hypothetical protein
MQIPFVKLEIFDPEEGAWGDGNCWPKVFKYIPSCLMGSEVP